MVHKDLILGIVKNSTFKGEDAPKVVSLMKNIEDEIITFDDAKIIQTLIANMSIPGNQISNVYEILEYLKSKKEGA